MGYYAQNIWYFKHKFLSESYFTFLKLSRGCVFSENTPNTAVNVHPCFQLYLVDHTLAQLSSIFSSAQHSPPDHNLSDILNTGDPPVLTCALVLRGMAQPSL